MTSWRNSFGSASFIILLFMIFQYFYIRKSIDSTVKIEDANHEFISKDGSLEYAKKTVETHVNSIFLVVSYAPWCLFSRKMSNMLLEIMPSNSTVKYIMVNCWIGMCRKTFHLNRYPKIFIASALISKNGSYHHWIPLDEPYDKYRLLNLIQKLHSPVTKVQDLSLSIDKLIYDTTRLPMLLLSHSVGELETKWSDLMRYLSILRICKNEYPMLEFVIYVHPQQAREKLILFPDVFGHLTNIQINDEPEVILLNLQSTLNDEKISKIGIWQQVPSVNPTEMFNDMHNHTVWILMNLSPSISTWKRNLHQMTIFTSNVLNFDQCVCFAPHAVSFQSIPHFWARAGKELNVKKNYSQPKVCDELISTKIENIKFRQIPSPSESISWLEHQKYVNVENLTGVSDALLMIVNSKNESVHVFDHWNKKFTSENIEQFFYEFLSGEAPVMMREMKREMKYQTSGDKHSNAIIDLCTHNLMENIKNQSRESIILFHSTSCGMCYRAYSEFQAAHALLRSIESIAWMRFNILHCDTPFQYSVSVVPLILHLSKSGSETTFPSQMVPTSDNLLAWIHLVTKDKLIMETIEKVF